MAKTPTTSPEDPEDAQARMTFGEHLEELRKRIVSAMKGSIFGVALCLYFYKEIMHTVARPYLLVARAHGLDGTFSALKPQEIFLTSITLAFQCGLVLSSPWIIYQLWQFVAAGLFPRERKIVYRYTAPSAFLFLVGVAFFYFIVLPMTLNFFMTFTSNTAGASPTPNWIERHLPGFGTIRPAAATTAPATATTSSAPPAATSATSPADPLPMPLPVLTAPPPPAPDGAASVFLDARDMRVKMLVAGKTFVLLVAEDGSIFSNSWRWDDYLSFVTFTALIFGVAFELPMVIMIIGQIGLVEVATFRSIRKYAYFTILVASVIIAPSGDPVFLIFLCIPLIGLYELGILAAAFAVRHQKTAAAE